MKLQAFTTLFAILTVANAHSPRPRHDHIVHKRQAVSSTSSAASSVTPSTNVATSSSTPQAGAPPATTGSSSASGVPGSSSVATPATVTTVPLATGTGIPPLAGITSGMPSQATLPVTATFAAGASPPVPGAPVLPTPFVFTPGDWPPQDKVPDTTSPQVQEWMKELDGFTIPSIPPTKDGSCAGDPAAAADAANRGWWTCGGHTRAVDVTVCPDKLTWGVSFDDGPSPYTQTLLNFLTEKALHATMFVVGSRCIERPSILVEEYMSGHEISVHTWSHRPLTSLTNEQVVAELGWTRKAIKTILGVTPTTMRPPFGDIDDRVRAISLAMGLQPIIWTSTPATGPFDTNDWRVAGGLVTGIDSFNTFNAILGNASSLNTGFIVLQHDLYEITVDLARGYTLNAALSHNPPFTLLPIGQCIKKPTSDLYLESNTNASFPYTNHTGGGVDTDGDGKIDTKSKAATSSSAVTAVAPLLSTLSLLVLGIVGACMA